MNRLIWLPKAKQKYLETLDSIVEYSVDAAIDLDKKVEKLILQIQTFKYSCPPSPFKENHRRCIVSKKFSLTYRIRKDTIYIIAFSDNRRG